jgi:hypothetical protein
VSTTPPPDPAPAAPAANPPAPRARQRARTAALLAARIAFDLLVIDAAVETWLAGSPARLAVAGGALLYFVLTAYVVSKGGRVGGRGWLMDPLAGAILFLGFLVAACWTPEGTINGVRALGQTAPAVLSGTMVALVAAAAVRATAPGGARSWWIRLPAILVSGYACVAFARAIPAGTAFRELLTGHGFWLRLPWWLQGTWLGAFVVLPAAFLREVGASIARLEAGPYLRWMLVFALGCWLAFNVASL